MLQRILRSIRSVLILSILLMFLTSCSSIKPLEVFNLEVKREPLNLDQPDIADFEDLDWYIITSDNAEEVFAKMQKDGVDPVLFGLSDEDYEILAKNFAQIRAYIIKQNATLEAYKEYYESETVKDEQK